MVVPRNVIASAFLLFVLQHRKTYVTTVVLQELKTQALGTTFTNCSDAVRLEGGHGVLSFWHTHGSVPRNSQLHSKIRAPREHSELGNNKCPTGKITGAGVVPTFFSSRDSAVSFFSLAVRHRRG